MRLLLLALLLAPALSAQDIVGITPEIPIRGEPVEVTFSAPVDSVTVTYRPGAVTASVETFAPGAATFAFTPERAGVVSVAGGDGSQNVSVRFRSTPLGGILVMLVAGVVLCGGAVVALRALMRDGLAIETDGRLAPDT
ncbi:MAG: hypothetical protein AAF845_05465 [Bacteroidota bacterium]